MRKSAITKNDWDKIVKLYTEEGKNTVEIAKLYSTYNTTIRRILIRNGIKPITISERLRKVNLKDISLKEGTPDFDYFIGILATDGCITSNRVVLDFSEDNKEILDYWNEFLGNKCKIRCSFHRVYKTPQYRIAFRNIEICKYLSKFGITSRKSSSLKLPYINWNVLRGIIDGDGCVRHQNNGRTVSIEITSGSEEFLKQIQEFLLKNSIVSHFHNITTSRNKSNIYLLTIHKSSDILTIYDNLYKNAHFFLKRKKDKYGSLLKKFNRQ